jgi:hypothetical protein
VFKNKVFMSEVTLGLHYDQRVIARELKMKKKGKAISVTGREGP